jgi:hypothetical protein
MALEISQRELRLWFRPHSNRRLELGDMSYQSLRSSFGTVSGPFLGSPGKKSHSDVVSVVRHREHYMGEGDGFPQVRVVVSQVSPRSPVACPNTRMSSNQLEVGFGSRTK